MTKITINDNTKKKFIKNMSGGTIFTYNNYYYMYIDLSTIVRLSDFTVWSFGNFPEEEHIICNAEIIIQK